jgi:hypothetical protein
VLGSIESSGLHVAGVSPDILDITPQRDIPVHQNLVLVMTLTNDAFGFGNCGMIEWTIVVILVSLLLQVL